MPTSTSTSHDDPTAPRVAKVEGRTPRHDLRRASWGHIFRPASDAAKVDATSHDLRHHAASLPISKGCSVKAVQSFLVHATAAETLDTYGHLWPDDDDRIRASIDGAWRAESYLSPAASE